LMRFSQSHHGSSLHFPRQSQLILTMNASAGRCSRAAERFCKFGLF